MKYIVLAIPPTTSARLRKFSNCEFLNYGMELLRRASANEEKPQ
jgi:hypothetical protein